MFATHPHNRDYVAMAQHSTAPIYRVTPKRASSDVRGSVFIEKLIAYAPLLLLFFMAFQLAELSAAQLVVRRASAAAARAAAVVLPDDPAYYDGDAIDVFEGTRRDDIYLAAAMIMSAAPQLDATFSVDVSDPPSAEFGPLDVTVNATYHCGGISLICGVDGTLALAASTQQAYHRAQYEYDILPGLPGESTPGGGASPTIGSTTQAVKNKNKKKCGCRAPSPPIAATETGDTTIETQLNGLALLGKSKSFIFEAADVPPSAPTRTVDQAKKRALSTKISNADAWVYYVRTTLRYKDDAGTEVSMVTVSYNDISVGQSLGHIKPLALLSKAGIGPDRAWDEANLFIEAQTLDEASNVRYVFGALKPPDRTHVGLEKFMITLLKDKQAEDKQKKADGCKYKPFSVRYSVELFTQPIP